MISMLSTAADKPETRACTYARVMRRIWQSFRRVLPVAKQSKICDVLLMTEAAKSTCPDAGQARSGSSGVDQQLSPYWLQG